MDTAVALVAAYLRFNGYISIPEQPILVGEGQPWKYHTATDLDILAVRFPHAAIIVPRDGGGPPWEDDDLKLEADPLLDLQEGVVDVLVAEVKEGRPRLNEALRDPVVLQAALARLDAGFDDPLERVAAALIERGEARTEAGGRKWRFRLAAFGDGSPVQEGGPFHVFSLRHVALFLMRTMAEHHKVWRDAQFGDTVLDLLHLLDKLGLGLKWVQAQRRKVDEAPVAADTPLAPDAWNDDTRPDTVLHPHLEVEPAATEPSSELAATEPAPESAVEEEADTEAWE